jgi:uncharacterized membrane protein YeaQ/YmgE (transglycosylase-associated protein family)
VALAGIGFVALHWSDAYQWKPDSLFYETQLLRVQGTSKDQALHQVFTGPLAAPRVAEELRDTPPARRTVASPSWVAYSSRFYERRWVVPALGAAVEPALGDDALRAVSLAGYVLCGLLVYSLLLLRFRSWIAAVVALGVLALGPLRYWSLLPLTDSFGVALEAAALATAVLALRRPKTWLPVFTLTMLTLSFTRDSTLVVVAGLAWVALRQRSRGALVTLATGIVASLPAPLLFGAPTREIMAYTLNQFRPPAHATWGFIRSRYVAGEKGLVKDDLTYLVHHPYVGLFAAGGIVALYALRSRGDDAASLMRGAVVGAVVLLLVAPNFTALRLELPFVPLAAYGVALALDAVRRRAPRGPMPVPGGRFVRRGGGT